MRALASLALGGALLLAGCREAAAPAGSAANCAAFTGSAGPLRALGCGEVASRFTSEIAARSGWAYTGTWGTRQPGVSGDAVFIWDARGDVPRLVDSIRVRSGGAPVATVGDLTISDDGRLLMIATEYSPGAIILYDRTDPARPVEVGRLETIDTYPGVHTARLARVGGRQHAFLSVNSLGARRSRIVIVDIDDPRAPRVVHWREAGAPFVHDTFVRDGYLFLALWDDGVEIWDIGGGGAGTPSSPVRVGGVRTVGGRAHNIWWFHDPVTASRRYAFVGEEGPGVTGISASGDLHVLDVSDLSAPREVAFFRVEGAGAHNVVMDEAAGILYAAFYNGGVRALDVRGDLSACAASARAPDGRCDLAAMGRQRGAGLTLEGARVYIWGVALDGGHLLASDMLRGPWKLAPLPR
jgi:hypothetical protein